MPFETVRSAQDSGVLVIALSGTMTMGTQLQQFEWEIAELAKKQQTKIVLDMAKLTYLDSSAIGVLVGCNMSVKAAGGQMRMAAVVDRVNTIFKMTGVDRVLSLDKTVDDSVAAFAAA